MTRKSRPSRRTGPLSIALTIALGACGGSRQRVVLEPGVQLGDAHVDIQAGTVSVERDGVVVEVQGAMLPAPRGDALHPTFWITVENTRDERLTVRPAAARLIDSFGSQLSPVPVSVSDGGRDVRYALVDPEIHTYVSLHFGWPYYPLYPYPGWFAHPRFSRLRYWHYDPFWAIGIGPIWIREIAPPRPSRPREAVDPDREETVYHDAKLTYVVVFPEIGASARDLRLVVPGVRIRTEEGSDRGLDFELIFRQIVTVGAPL